MNQVTEHQHFSQQERKHNMLDSHLLRQLGPRAMRSVIQ